MRPLAIVAVVLALALGPLAASAQLVPAPDADATAEAPDAAEAARLLAEVLADPQARAALIAQLEAAAAGTTTEPAPPAPPETSIARALVDRTLGLARGISSRLSGPLDALRDLDGLAAALGAVDWRQTAAATVALAVVAAITIGVYAALRWLARGVPARLAARTGAAGWARQSAGLVLVAAFELALMLLAWAAGYALAPGVGPGTIDLRQLLFLNAFLAVELCKLALRLILAPRYPALRLPPMSDRTATEWYVRPARIVALLGYGLLLAAPVAAASVAPGVGAFVKLGVVLAAGAMTIGLVLRNRLGVRDAFAARAARDPDGITGRSLAAVGRIWHAIAIAYVAGLVVIWFARPAGALGFMIAATLQSAAAVLIGTLAMAATARLTAGGIAVPEAAGQRLPTLEARVNGLLPGILAAIRIVVAVLVIAAILHAWSIFDAGLWLATDAGQVVLGSLFAAALILVLATLIWLAVSSWIELKLNPGGERTVTARERTLLALLRNAFTVALVVIAGMLALAAVGVNIAPLLAGAGVVGLAIGFGAQKLVQDIITGAFIQVENAMNTGDVVTAGGITGVVEKLTIRSVGLRTLDGTYHLIPFSSVDTVSNAMKDFSYHVAEIGVAYRENIAEVKALMGEAFERLKETDHGPSIIGPLDMQGLVAFADSAVIVRARIMTLPGKHWALGRAYSEILKATFDAAGIEIPFPHLTIYMGADKAGGAPPLNLRPAPDAAPIAVRIDGEAPGPT